MQTHINTLLTKLTIAYRSNSESMMNEVGLHSGQAQILNVLWSRDGQSQAELRRELNISAPTVTSLVSKLEKAKFVKCKTCVNDRRIIRVYLTKKGSDIRDETRKQYEILEKNMLKDFSDTEKIMLMMLLEKLKKNLVDDDSEIS